MKRWRGLCLIFVLTLMVASFNIMYEGDGITRSDPYEKYTEGDYMTGAYGWISLEPVIYVPSGSYGEVLEGSGGGVESIQYLFEEIHYRKDGVDAVYPHFVSGASEEEMAAWNQIIDTDIQNILSIYSFRPLPLPTPAPSAKEQAERKNASPTAAPRKAEVIFLRITYEIKSADDDNFSVFYQASFNPEYVAHPTQLAYSTNIGLKTSKRQRLSDIVKLNEAFVEDFRHWDIITEAPRIKEFDQAVRDYVQSLSDNELLIGLQTADMIGAGNYLGIYSYLVPGKLGISLSVPNYLGDHVEFEKAVSELEDYMLTDTQTVSSILQQ